VNNKGKKRKKHEKNWRKMKINEGTWRRNEGKWRNMKEKWKKIEKLKENGGKSKKWRKQKDTNQPNPKKKS
jgi:hypothetical protein